MQKPKIIIDTDPGHDDALAIMLLELSNQFEILAITTVAGNSTIQNTTNNARYVLDLLDSKTPLYSGANKPLKRALIQAKVHGENGLAGAIIKKQEKLTDNAAVKIIELAKKYPKQISILTIGPMTNLATAILKEKSLPTKIKQVVSMGGAIEVPGNKNRVAEFNIFVDPDAADVVFRANVKKTLIPLDASNDVFLTLNDFKKLNRSKMYLPIMEMMKEYIGGIHKFEKTKGAIMYDPLAAYFLINPKAYKTKMMDIKVETQSELTRGMTVADRRIWGDKKPNVSVVTAVDRKKFVNDFLKIIKK